MRARVSGWALARLFALALTACSTPQAAPLQRPAETFAPDPDAGVPATKVEPPEGSLASNESKRVAKTLAKVSEMRGLASTKSVPGVTLERDQLVGRVKDKAMREYPAEALRREGLLVQLMGFAPPSFDYLSEMMKLLEAQLEGFYDPKNGTMYLAADLQGPQAEATLAHELVHALQDQKWDLKQRSEYKPGRGDEVMAIACLAEGDATSLMLDYTLKDQHRSALDIPPAAIRDLMKSGMSMGAIQTVPHILRTTLVAPYMEGVAFVHELRKKGGWASVDSAWNRLPTTTEQILHVAKWEAQEGGIAIPAPSAAALGAGWVNEDADTYGELGLALMLAEWMGDDAARVAASGWGGDRTSIFTKGEEIAHAMHLRFDVAPAPAKDDAFAERTLQKLTPALRKQLGTAAAADASSICFERKALGPLLFGRKDRELVMIAGPARVANGTWSSTGTCATAKKWATEVAAQK